MAKVTKSTLSSFFATKVQNKKTSVKVTDETATLTFKAEGAPTAYSETGVVSFLKEHAEVKVQQKVELENGAVISSSGTASGKDSAAAVKTAFTGETDEETQPATVPAPGNGQKQPAGK